MNLTLRTLYSVIAAIVCAGFIGCGGSAKLPAPAERLPGKWHGEMIIYEETQGKMTADEIEKFAQMQWDFDFKNDGSMALSGMNSGAPFSTEGRWTPLNQDGDLLTIKSTEQSGGQKDIKIEFDGRDTFFIPVNVTPAPDQPMVELGAMRFTRLR
jgi:hypothetical protein